ncbi:CaiB/BaiF CoA transferase family protein [Pseudotabrizicola alkalilacus]|uniref:CoA transferase n=1 Tax=Pseudotabrizicola alkalilacus TaxID=2305252 RepID=A0A411Z4P8_9RHOB|nr:CaiB/BaiF CoA-transferase family protein [Pseudotabrizicola alkalilacus]RGP38024.1 CoA transferase [Pseudotabrizicola alkalilacus]
MTSAFSGLRVIDTTHVLAGPFASYQLALLGAEVIKIESPNDPDQARFQGADRDLVRQEMGAAFLSQSAGKKALALDLKTPSGREALKRLAATADVFVENYRSGAFEALGLGYADLAAINPGLIYCSISAFGGTGPKRSATGYDNVIQSYSGIMDVTGTGDGNPLKCGAPVIDYSTGMTAAFAIATALFQRSQNGGKGQHIDVSMLEVALTLQTSHVTDFLHSGKHPKARGNSYAFATIGMYQASDAPLMVAASNLRQQRRLWIALGREDLVKTNNFDRIDMAAEEREALTEIFATMTADYWEQFLNERRIPAARVRRMEEALSDQQTAARGQIQRVSDPAGHVDGLQILSSAFRMSDSDTGTAFAPQAVGAQTTELLREIGMTEAEIEAMLQSGVARQARAARTEAAE